MIKSFMITKGSVAVLTLARKVCAANVFAGCGAFGERSRTLHIDHASG